VRKRFKIPLFSLAFLLLVVAGVVIWVIRSGWLQRRVMAYVNQALAVKTTLVVDIGTLGGNPFSFVAADDIVIHTKGRVSDTLATIKHFSIQYDISDLWQRHWIIESILLDSPRVFLPRDSLTRVLRSIVRSEPGEKPSRSYRYPSPFFSSMEAMIHARLLSSSKPPKTSLWPGPLSPLTTFSSSTPAARAREK